MVPIHVIGLNHAPGAPTALVVVRTETGDRQLGFFIPMNEADRLARQLGLVACRCAPIWDLVDELVRTLNGSIARAVIDASREGIVARLDVRRGAASFSFPCHPGDALGLALRTAAPIFATPGALAHAHPSDGHLASWLEGLRPSDFGEPGEVS